MDKFLYDGFAKEECESLAEYGTWITDHFIQLESQVRIQQDSLWQNFDGIPDAGSSSLLVDKKQTQIKKEPLQNEPSSSEGKTSGEPEFILGLPGHSDDADEECPLEADGQNSVSTSEEHKLSASNQFNGVSLGVSSFGRGVWADVSIPSGVLLWHLPKKLLTSANHSVTQEAEACLRDPLC